jgi:hypothetical protein
VQLGDNSSLGYKLGTENKGNIKQKKREGVPRGSIRQGHLIKLMPHGTVTTKHISKELDPS